MDLIWYNREVEAGVSLGEEDIPTIGFFIHCYSAPVIHCVLLVYSITSIFQTDEPRLNGFSAIFKDCELISAEQTDSPGSA